MINPFTTSPYPRTYWAGFNRQEDEKLAEQLLYGITVRNEKGRMHHAYLPDDSPHARQGFEALQRLLLFSCKDLAPSILMALLSTLDPNGGAWGRLVFKRPRKGRKDIAADFQIYFYVEHLIKKGEQAEAAVSAAEAEFGLTRKAIYEARRRTKRRNSDIVNKRPPFPGFPFLLPGGSI